MKFFRNPLSGAAQLRRAAPEKEHGRGRQAPAPRLTSVCFFAQRSVFRHQDGKKSNDDSRGVLPHPNAM